ncbi:hypothetical protein D6D17_06291 [Aureobasidium pullulans]|nr:hypothetical protein D6D17_06291 [Aureobasidium pullulans]
MLRCAFLRRALRNPRHHYQQGLQYRQSGYGPQVHPARWLGFLPLATNDEIAGKDPASNIGDKTGNVTDPGQSNGSDTTLRLAKLDVNSTSSFSTISPTTTQSCTETQEPETEHFDGGRRRDRTFFSASLFDGTIMFLWDGLIDLNGFKDLVMIVDGLWRKDSRDMSSRLPAQNIGLGIREGKFRDGFLSVNVWDIGVGTGTRPRLIYELIVPDEHSPCRANAWVLRCFIPDTKTYSWRKGTGVGLFRALKNYVGAVDHASSLNLFDPSIIHPLAHKMERFEQQFGLRECTTRPPNPMSFDLATHTIVSPSSVMVMTLEGFLTKATVLWQWWQRIDSHSLLAPDNSDAMTFVQIRQVDTSNDSFLVDVWRMSFAPDKSLSKSVHKILVSNDGSFGTSQVEMSEVMFSARSKQDQPLREYLKSCLKNHVGFMDGVGNVVQQSQSKTHPLLLKLNRHKDFSSRMLPPKEARHTKPRAKSESDNSQLVTDTTKSKNYADVVSMNEEQIQPPLSKRGPEIADTPRCSKLVLTHIQYFFKVAGLADPFLVTIITFVLPSNIFLCFFNMRQIRPSHHLNFVLSGCFWRAKGSSGVLVALGHLLRRFCRGFVAAGETSTPRLRAQTTSFNLGCYGLGFVVFQWTVSYMISPDAANLGIKAVYVWAGLLVPFTILLWLYYPETYGRTYWELDELYERKIPAWKFKNTPTLSDQSGHKNAALMSERAKQEAKTVI